MKDLTFEQALNWAKEKAPHYNWQAYCQVGRSLRSELMFGGYMVEDWQVSESDNVVDDNKFMPLYDRGGQYAVYNLNKLKAVCRLLQLPKDDLKQGYTLWEVFPVSEFMQIVEELDVCSRHGLVYDDYMVWGSIRLDNTEFYTEQWFDGGLDAKITDLLKYGWHHEIEDESSVYRALAKDLENYVNQTDYDKFAYYSCVSQWDYFCKLAGYPQREDYFGVLSSTPSYDRLLQDETYLLPGQALTAVKEAAEAIK